MASRRDTNAAATRAALLRIARQLFAERGYADTGTEELVRRARVTRGALYHHFKDKLDLFRAVMLEEERRLAAAVAEVAARQPDPLAALSAGCGAFLDACQDRAVRQIVLIDGPAVLGWEAYRQIDAEYFLAGTVAALKLSMDAGLIAVQPVVPLAHAIMGAIHESALLLAHAQDQVVTRDEVSSVVARLLAGLRAAS